MHRIAVLGISALLSLLIAATATATAPEGPRLAFVRWRDHPTALELVSASPSGSEQQLLAGGGNHARPLPYPLAAPGFSPDGNLIAFAGITRSPGAEAPPTVEIFVAAADGSDLRAVPGTVDGYGPIFSPDGASIAFARIRQSTSPSTVTAKTRARRYRSVAVWMVDLDGANLRQLTRWRNGLESFPSSFAPDGSVLALSRRDRRRSGSEAVALRLDGSGSTLLARNAADPTYSPDGSKVALVREYTRRAARNSHGKTAGPQTTTDLFVIDANGSRSIRLTRTPAKIEASPSWDPSGQRLAYTQLDANAEFANFGFGDALMEINADGSCRTRILSNRRSSLFGAVWQPGPAREAGRIQCK
jgi:Tol biopolymer transport system component